MSLLRYANSSIRNTSLLGLDVNAAHILPFLLLEMSQLHDVVLPKAVPCVSSGDERI
jgi:hypothetical protein